MNSDERRSNVRGDILFRVKFKILSPREYEKLKNSGDYTLHAGNIDNGGNAGEILKNLPAGTDAHLMDFLIRLDEKLDRILTILANEKNLEGPFNSGTGVNISATGMKMITNIPIESGQIIHTNFILSKGPLIYIDAFGEVVRVIPVEEDGKSLYYLGIQFLDLNPNDREKIIACIFRRQREEIRKRRNGSSELKAI